MNIATGGGTLVHEIVHPFMAANFEQCPSWFNEGLGSLYEQSAAGADWVYQVWEVEPGRFLKLARKGHEVCILDTTDPGLLRAFWE